MTQILHLCVLVTVSATGCCLALRLGICAERRRYENVEERKRKQFEVKLHCTSVVLKMLSLLEKKSDTFSEKL